MVHSRHPDKLQGRLENMGKNKVTADAMESTDNPSSRPMSQPARTEEGKKKNLRTAKRSRAATLNNGGTAGNGHPESKYNLKCVLRKNSLTISIDIDTI